MPRPDALPRIVSNPKILGGEPVLEGTRVPAETVLAELREGTTALPPGSIEACRKWYEAGPLARSSLDL